MKTKLFTAHELSKLTGRSYNRMTTFLADVQPAKESKRADGTVIRHYELGAVFDCLEGRATDLDPQAEKARLDYWRRREIELRTRARASELAETDVVLQAWASGLTTVRTALLNLPHRVAPLLAAHQHESDHRATLTKEVRRILAELSELPPTEFPTVDESPDWQEKEV